MISLTLKICSVVLLPALNPACSSASISSAFPLSLFKVTQHDLVWVTDEANGRFCNFCSLKFPFFGNGMIMDLVHSLGHSFVFQILWHSVVRTFIISGPPCLSCSAGMLSALGDFPHFSIRNASSTSSVFTCILSVSSKLLVLLFGMLVSGFSS